MIEIKNLQKMWTNGNVVLEDINLCIADGEIYGLAGRSGAGKSTLLRCINGLESFSSGTLTVNNVAVNRLNKEELRQFRKNIGMIFQQPSILERKTVYENIAFPMKCWGVPEAERRAKAEELIHLVELDEKRDVKAKTLSGGQKQRVAIARALTLNPSVLLCDEATSALDPNTTQNILKLLNKINKELHITIVIVTHEMSVIRDACTKVAIFEHGKIVENGDPADIFRNDSPALRRLLGDERYMPQGDTNVEITVTAGTQDDTVMAHMVADLHLVYKIVDSRTEHFKTGSFSKFVITFDSNRLREVEAYLKDRKTEYRVLIKAASQAIDVKGDDE